MSYKKEAAAAHKAKCKGYADGGGVEGMGSPSLLDTVAGEAMRKLSSQGGPSEEGAPPPEEI